MLTLFPRPSFFSLFLLAPFLLFPFPNIFNNMIKKLIENYPMLCTTVQYCTTYLCIPITLACCPCQTCPVGQALSLDEAWSFKNTEGTRFSLEPEPDQQGAPYKYYKYNITGYFTFGIHKYSMKYSFTQHLRIFIIVFSHQYIKITFF